MHLKLLGISLAAALLLTAFPAAAAVSPSFETAAPVQVAIDDCPVVAAAIEAKFFINADLGCELIMGDDLADVCLVEAKSAPPATVAVIFLPNEPMGCTTIRPSPPG